MQKTEDTAALPVPCRADCRFFSSYTSTCDYSLIMYQTRGCPKSACTRYVPRVSSQPAPRLMYEDGLYYHAPHETPVEQAAQISEEGEPMYTPEPPLAPPEDGRCVVAGCGHEVYDGEDLFEWENGRTLCADCLSDRFNELSVAERAELLGCEHRAVSFPPRGGPSGALSGLFE